MRISDWSSDVCSSDLIDTPVSIDVLGNDDDPDGDPLMVDGFTQPTNGTVASNADGTLRYTPDSGFTGSDSFTYTASDGSSTTTASVPLPVAAAERVVLGGTSASHVLDGSSEHKP